MLAALVIAALGLGPPTLPDPEVPAAGQFDLRVEWSTTAECGDVAQVYERVRALAPHLSLASADADAAVRVEARVERRDIAWVVELELVGPQQRERRSFTAESCAIAIEATALILAVAVDPVAVVDTLDRAPEPEAEPEPEPEPPPEPDPEPTSEEPIGLDLVLPATAELPVRKPPRLRAGLGLVGGGGYGPLAAGSAALGLRMATLGPSWRVELRGLWLAPVPVSLGDRGRVRVDGVVGAARGCGLLRARKLEFPLCGGIEAGAIRAQPLTGIRNAVAATQPYFGFELGAGLTWAPLDRFALGLELDALVPLVSGGFTVDEEPALPNLPVGVRALAGVELRLP